MSILYFWLALVPFLVSLAGTIMSFARTAPDDAANNLGQWLASLRAVVRRPKVRIVAAVVCTLSGLGLVLQFQFPTTSPSATSTQSVAVAGSVSNGAQVANIINNFYSNVPS